MNGLLLLLLWNTFSMKAKCWVSVAPANSPFGCSRESHRSGRRAPRARGAAARLGRRSSRGIGSQTSRGTWSNKSRCAVFPFRGIVASILVFLCFGVTQAKDGPFSRPHPGNFSHLSHSDILGKWFMVSLNIWVTCREGKW